MILSRRHSYIFLHCRKTAGSSIAVSLARDLGPDDLQLSGLRECAEMDIAPPEATRAEAWKAAASYPVGKRLKVRAELRGLYGKARKDRALRKALLNRYALSLGTYPMHAKAERIRDAFPEEWTAFKKFCVVRNPYDKVVSDYYWRIRDADPAPDFDTFVRAMRDGDAMGGLVPVGRADNWPMYAIDDQIVADRVIRYEALATELPAALEALGIPWDGWLPNAKGSHRPKSARAGKDSLYTPDLVRIVGDLFQREIEAFGYGFDLTSA